MLRLVTAPAAEPVTVDEARLHLRVDEAQENGLIIGHIATARLWVETLLERQLVPATWDLVLDRFPPSACPIVMPRPPLVAVESVTYVDEAGTAQTWDAASYTVEIPVGEAADCALLRPAYGEAYPTTRHQRQAVTVRFTAGYDGDVQPALPDTVKSAVKLIVGDLFARREPGAAGTYSAVEMMLGPLRVLRV